jgi:hypothetical protein
MQVTIREIIVAHAKLVRMYREVFPHLRDNLKVGRGIDLRQQNDLERGVAGMTSAVRTAGCLKVSSLNNTSLYPYTGNEWFRTVHDMVHILYGLGFTPGEEKQVHDHLWVYLRNTAAWWDLPTDQQAVVAAVYRADTYGQTEYERRNGCFPADQGAFTIK